MLVELHKGWMTNGFLNVSTQNLPSAQFKVNPSENQQKNTRGSVSFESWPEIEDKTVSVLARFISYKLYEPFWNATLYEVKLCTIWNQTRRGNEELEWKTHWQQQNQKLITFDPLSCWHLRFLRFPLHFPAPLNSSHKKVVIIWEHLEYRF